MQVVSHPNPVLAQTCYDVDPTADTSLRDLVVDMGKTMYGAEGVGLAAPQVGVLKRVIVYDVSAEGDSLVALFNPQIVEFGDELETVEEGCLSLPGIAVPIERASSVVCEGQNLSGEHIRFAATGLHARVLQHEIDHLSGTLILDRATPEERKAALRRYREAIEHGARPGDTSY